MSVLKNDIKYIKGVGPARSKLLNKIGIYTVEDALYYYPKSYEDRGRISKISELVLGNKHTLKCRIASEAENYKTKTGLTITKVRVEDGTGAVFCIWFNQPYMKTKLKFGKIFYIYGKIESKFGQLQINNPIIEDASHKENIYTTSITPIYSLTKNLSQNNMLKIMRNVVQNAKQYIEDIFPDEFLKKYDLISKKEALCNIHFPRDRKSYLNARKRLVFEELFELQLSLLYFKMLNTKNKQGIKFSYGNGRVKEFLNSLPYKLTQAQQRVIHQVLEDMQKEKPMNRLIQGDVGSGKTIIAVAAMLKAVINGYQSVMMVPTEILAEQHYKTIKDMFNPLGINVALLTRKFTQRKKAEILKQIYNGGFDIIIGTHSIIQDNTKFNKLGLVITDEQHRFGVEQRAVLEKKAQNPDVLVMSATPIPRTLMHVLYGDLDISIIDQLPPGRKEVKTYHIFPSKQDRLDRFILDEIRKGRQVYMVCPLIEESDSVNAVSANKLYKDIQKRFTKVKVALMHGKLKKQDKENIMENFYNGNIDILVSTTVIEVGVNVPNATVMVVQNAERFGLAQLHQLRGRVGRGNHQAYCILVSNLPNDIARERIKVMVNTTDGFEIAQKDLEIRGPGEFFGVKQHGIPELKIADLTKDIKILDLAKQAAIDIIEKGGKNSRYSIIIDHIVNDFKLKIKKIALN